MRLHSARALAGLNDKMLVFDSKEKKEKLWENVELQQIVLNLVNSFSFKRLCRTLYSPIAVINVGKWLS